MATTAMPMEPDPVQEDSRETRKMDPELLVMQRIMRMLEELEQPAAWRVIYWLHSRYAAGNNFWHPVRGGGAKE